MKNPCKHALIAAALSVSIAAPQLVSAQSVTSTGASPSANASVDFQIIIPGVLRFRVGQAGGGIDTIEFAPTAAEVAATGTDVAATAVSGDLGNGDVTVEVLSNSGQITISHDSNGIALSDGGTNTIPYTEILTASSTANLDAPALGTAGVTLPTLTGTNLTNESAIWTYTYDNAATYPSGIYGGSVANNGRVTYTASAP
jgi:hypothetical protein